MQAVESDFGPVCVCIPSTSITRYVLFETSFEGMHSPSHSCSYRIISASPAKNRNDAIRLAPPECTHFFFMDDDHHFADQLLMNLLRHRLPVVCCVTPIVRPPFNPVLFKSEKLFKPGLKKFLNIPWAELDRKHGLMPIFSGPGAGLLVTRQVLEKIGEPWFEMGKTDPEQAGEDMYFYEKCRNAGIPTYVDLDQTMGHMTPISVWPVQRDDGKWTIHLVFENGQQIKLPRSDDEMPSIEMPKERAPQSGPSKQQPAAPPMPVLQEQAKSVIIR